MNEMRHFLDLDILDVSVLREILHISKKIKTNHLAGRSAKTLLGKSLVCIFEKPSTRTRISFQIGIEQLGGSAVIINGEDSHLGSRESIADTARVLSRYADGIMIRTDRAAKLHELAKYASIPVINGLTDESHPCQIMADIMTFEEHRGEIAGKNIAWSGDGNNVLNSWIHAAAHFNFVLRIGCPSNRLPSLKIIDAGIENGGDIRICRSPAEAIEGAHLVLTDTWVSMGNENAVARRQNLRPFQVDQALMALAANDAVFMHCLPAHRGEEVTEEVIDGSQSLVWDEAENRLHIQKGILNWCLE